MTQTYNLRPREKMMTRSASALSDHELLQALIGTGTRHIDVAKVARQTLKVLRQHRGIVTFMQLKSIPGLGTAYASRILAAFELARRWNYLRRPDTASPTLVTELMKHDQKIATLLVYDLFDGGGGFIDRKFIALHESINQATVIHQLVAITTSLQAVTIDVGISGNHTQRLMYMSDIVYCRTLKTTLDSIGVHLRTFTVATNGTVKELL